MKSVFIPVLVTMILFALEYVYIFWLCHRNSSFAETVSIERCSHNVSWRVSVSVWTYLHFNVVDLDLIKNSSVLVIKSAIKQGFPNVDI